MICDWQWSMIGEGPPIVKTPGWITHLRLDWRTPSLAHILSSLASRQRLLMFDSRGNGLSDWNVDNLSFEWLIDDLECVLNAAGIDRTQLIGVSQGLCDRRGICGAVSGTGVGHRHDRRLRRRAGQSQVKKDQERARAMAAMMSAGWDDEYPSLRGPDGANHCAGGQLGGHTALCRRYARNDFSGKSRKVPTGHRQY